MGSGDSKRPTMHKRPTKPSSVLLKKEAELPVCTNHKLKTTAALLSDGKTNQEEIRESVIGGKEGENS